MNIVAVALFFGISIYTFINRYEWHNDGATAYRVKKITGRAELCDIDRNDLSLLCGTSEILEVGN